MNVTLITRVGAFAVASAVLAGCATQDGNNTAIGAASGGALGAALGEAIGGNAQAAAIGAAAGLAGGALVGQYWQDLSQRLSGSPGEKANAKATQQSDNSLLVTLPGNATFARGSARLNTAIYPTLDKIAGEMKANPALTIDVRGFTDSTGNPLANKRLSQRRAQAIADYLTEQGVPSARIASVGGFGDADPVADNATEEGRAANRRAELYLRSASAPAASNQ